METIPLDATTRFRRSAKATYQTIEGEAVLIHLDTGAYYSLNDVGTSFWELIDGTRTVGECAAKLATEYDAPIEVVTSDLLELAEDLVKEGLVEKV